MEMAFAFYFLLKKEKRKKPVLFSGLSNSLPEKEVP